ncbi:MAG: serine hydrolase [bacterium]
MKIKTNLSVIICSMICFCLFQNISAQNLDAQFDAIVSEYYNNNDAPGASVLVAKNGKAIYSNAFGKANLELDVPMTTKNVFELASITKQFTAVAILMLEEQGKLSVNDPITKFISDYPTQGKKITIHQLLNHTSGIKSYTSMENLEGMARQDMSVTELINYFKNEPMDFDPGEAFAYNNSGYILLGHIIEIITNDTYENFIENQIFKPLAMTNSRYGSKSEFINYRASGYQQNETGYENANYISMDIPYAAGSLMSTVEDMLKWQNALRNNTLIKSTSLEKAINGSKLNNGEEIDYGYGLGALNFRGSKGYAHSGGIFGFSTNGIYLIDEDVYVIGLSNCSCNDIGAVTRKLAAAAIGKPFPSKNDVIKLTEKQLNKWVGAYEFEGGVVRHIFIEDGQLKSMRESESNTVFNIYPLSESRFMFDDGIEYNFSELSNGKRQVVFITDSEAIGNEIEKEMPKLRESIELPDEILETYVGKYELAPQFIITITHEDQKLFAQATGQPQFEIFAEKEDHFYLKVVAASIEFTKDESGAINGLILNQGGQKMPAKKTE